MSVLPREQRLVEAIVEVAGTTGPGLDVSELLYNLAANSVDLLDTDTASVHIADDHGALETIATCGEDSRYVELFAEHIRDGPSVECYRTATVVSSVDLDLERSRWRAFTAKARRLGFRSVYGVPMRSDDHVVGGLTLLRTRAGPLADADVAVAQCLATVATLSLVHHRARRSHAAVRGSSKARWTAASSSSRPRDTSPATTTRPPRRPSGASAPTPAAGISPSPPSPRTSSPDAWTSAEGLRPIGPRAGALRP